MTIRTGWRRYDPKTGRAGEPIDKFQEDHQPAVNFNQPPIPENVIAQDDGDGNVTVEALGAFKAGTRVRLGASVQAQDPTGQTQSFNATSTFIEQNDKYIRFTVPAVSLAMNGAFLLNRDGSEWPVVPRFQLQNPLLDSIESLDLDSLQKCLADPPNPISLSPSAGDPEHSVKVTVTGKSEQFVAGDVSFTKDGEASASKLVIARGVKAKDDDHLIVDVSIAKDAKPGQYQMTVPSRMGRINAHLFTVGSLTEMSVLSADANKPRPEGLPGQTLTVKVKVRSATFDPKSPPTVRFSGAGITVNKVDLLDTTTLKLCVTIASDAEAGPRDVIVDSGTGSPMVAPGLFTVLPTEPQLILRVYSPGGPQLKPEGLPGHTLTIDLVVSSAKFDKASPPAVSIGDGITVGTINVRAPTVLRFDAHIAPDAKAGPRAVSVNSVALQPSSAFTVLPSARVEPFSDTTDLVRLTLTPTQGVRYPDQPDVVVVGGNVFGLRNNPF